MVASFTDAWIETLSCKNNHTALKSHLLQMRGLKLNILIPRTLIAKSHLLQMRGLKQMDVYILMIGRKVASFTDAWIETFSDPTFIELLNVASFTDAWIETMKHGVKRATV